MPRIGSLVAFAAAITAVLVPAASAAQPEPFVWAFEIDTGEDTDASAGRLATTTDGDLIVFTTAVLQVGGIYDDHHVHLARIAADGRVRWERSFGRLGRADYAGSVTTDSEDNIYLSYSSPLGDREPGDAEMRKYTPDGDLVWKKRRGGGFDLDVIGDTLFGTRQRIGSDSYPETPARAALLVEFGLDGVERARRPIGSPSVRPPVPGYASNLGPAPSGGLHYTTSDATGGTIVVVHTDRHGDEHWRNVTLRTEPPSQLVLSRADATGNLAVAWTEPTDPDAVWVHRVAADGSTSWTERIGHPAWADVTPIEISSNAGGQLVLGLDVATARRDFAVVVLEQSGQVRSISNVGHRDRLDRLAGVAVSPQGRVYATGWGLADLLSSDGHGWVGRVRTSVAPAPSCHGMPATLVGTDGPDHIAGSTTRDVILAGAGRDRIDGRGGDDVICAGPGWDEIDAGRGADVVYGEGGSDVVDAAGGRDFVHGGPGDDRLDGGPGRDRVWGGGALDECWGEQLRCEISHRTRHDDP